MSIVSQYGEDWPLHCPSCDATQGAMVNYVGPSPFVMRTVKGDMLPLTDCFEFGGNTIGECQVCFASFPLIQWIYQAGLGDRKIWREPGAAKMGDKAGHWFDDWAPDA